MSWGLVTGRWLSCEGIWWHPQVVCVWSLLKAVCGPQRALSKHALLAVAVAVWVLQPSGWLDSGHGDLTLPSPLTSKPLLFASLTEDVSASPSGHLAAAYVFCRDGGGEMGGGGGGGWALGTQ